ncbi:hypothetical protein HAX54_006845 [Datura stramonium]|uniref:Uncharacterized protein n=1 Tax=Datura stramonium TaxID=4076 RepID=A0ABS8WWZ5_DATST|nr:hypothetical protein [Datura stramonium]
MLIGRYGRDVEETFFKEKLEGILLNIDSGSEGLEEVCLSIKDTAPIPNNVDEEDIGQDVEETFFKEKLEGILLNIDGRGSEGLEEDGLDEKECG